MRLLEPTAQIWMKIVPYMQRQKCRPMTLVPGKIRYMRILAGVPLGGALKWEWGGWGRLFVAIWLATSSETSEIRPAILYDDMLPLVGLLLAPPLFRANFGVFPLHQIVHVGRPCLTALSYSAVKLFSKHSNLCDHGTWTSQTDWEMTCCGITALCVASRGKKNKTLIFIHHRRLFANKRCVLYVDEFENYTFDTVLGKKLASFFCQTSRL